MIVLRFIFSGGIAIRRQAIAAQPSGPREARLASTEFRAQALTARTMA